MNGDFRREVLLLAVLVSVGIHFGTMVAARSAVMTHGLRPDKTKVARHEKMRVIRAEPLPETVKVDDLRDEKATKAGPEAESSAEIPLQQSGGDEIRPAPSPLVPEPTTRPPEPLDRAVLDVKPVDLDVRKGAPVMPTTVIEAPRPVGELPAPATPLPMPAAAPIALPKVPAVLDSGSLFSVVESSRRETLAAPPVSSDRTGFVPVREVTEKVDHKLVEREKEAVRDLVNRDDASELASFVSVSVAKQASGPWTYFRASVRPKADLAVVSKDVVALIDASGSIGKDRMRSIREAAKQFLRSSMNTGDRFNLVAFRDRYDYASKVWMPCDERSFGFADRWLDNLTAHGRTDVFATISSVLTLPRDPTRPLVALVITDGEANKGVSDTAEILSKFTALNDGLVSVYIYGVKTTGNKELIDVLTRGNRGESVVYDGWLKWNTGSKLENLAARFRDPVLSDLRLVFAADAKADAYPRRLRNLYRGDRLDVVGRVPAGTREVAFSLRGLNGKTPYEGYFKLRLDNAVAADDATLAAQWTDERKIDQKLGQK